MEGTQKKGLSKGCLVALIIAGVLLVIIIIAGITCYIYKDDVMKMGMVTIINGFKTELVNNPVEGVDTAQFNMISDAFIAKFNESKIDYENYGPFIQSLQAMMSDKKVEADEVAHLKNMMLDYYPELEKYQTVPELSDTLLFEDNVPEEATSPGE